MQVKSFDNDKLLYKLKYTDPYIKMYVKSLIGVSEEWKRLFHDAMKKIRELQEIVDEQINKS